MGHTKWARLLFATVLSAAFVIGCAPAQQSGESAAEQQSGESMSDDSMAMPDSMAMSDSTSNMEGEESGH